MRELDLALVQQQFSQTESLIAQYNNGSGTSVIRFPYGEYSAEQAAATGKPCLFWDLDTFDWDTRDSSAIVNAVLTNIEGGNILLMHDIYPETIEACGILIPELTARGYQLVTIQELAAAKGYQLEPGVTYYGFTDHYIAERKVTDRERGEGPESQ